MNRTVAFSLRPCCGNVRPLLEWPRLLVTRAAPHRPLQPRRYRAAMLAPQAVPAKIAVIEYEQVAAATNEGQRALQELQKKYEPQEDAAAGACRPRSNR